MSDLLVQSDRHFIHAGRRLFYDIYGDRDAPVTVIYLHGLLLDSDLNRGVARALAAHGHRVVLMDVLGHGRSDKPTHASEYRIDSYAVQVIALMDHLNIDRAVLGGLSLGANVSLFAAATHPERVSGLILEMPVLERAVPSAALAFVPMVLLSHYGAAVMGPISAFVSRLPRTPFGPINSFMSGASLAPDAMSAVLHGVLVGPIAPTQDQRRAMTQPTLIMAHRNDLIHPFDDAASLAGLMPNATLVRSRSPLELRLLPDRLTREIVSFLDRLASSDALTPGRKNATGEAPAKRAAKAPAKRAAKAPAQRQRPTAGD